MRRTWVMERERVSVGSIITREHKKKGERKKERLLCGELSPLSYSGLNFELRVLGLVVSDCFHAARVSSLKPPHANEKGKAEIPAVVPVLGF